MTAIVIAPKVCMRSGRILAEELGVRFMNPYETGVRDFTGHDVIINYGFSRPFHANKIINTTTAVRKSIDKLVTLNLLDDTDNVIVPYTLNRNTAMAWLREEGRVVCRETNVGSNAQGVTIVESENAFRNTPAMYWSKYIEFTNEFRINVWRNRVVSIYDKDRVKENGKEVLDFKLFKGQEAHPQVTAIVEKVFKNIKLDWCGIDVLRDGGGRLYVLEVNSAPVLYFDSTLETLTNILRKEI